MNSDAAGAVGVTSYFGAADAGRLSAAPPASKSLPTTLTRTYEVGEVPTDFFVQLFSDRIFVAVSQLKGKLGTLLTCTAEESVIDGSTTYYVSTLLGVRDDAVLEVYARQITERIASLGQRGGDGPICPPILLGIALQKGKGRENNEFKTVVDLVLDMYLEAIRIASS